MVTGSWFLVIGFWLLVSGCWFIVGEKKPATVNQKPYREPGEYKQRL
jgi:hypothetical protein